jgi:hypothetical protein
VEDSEGKFMPTRYLKPGIRDSESIDKLSPLAETLFYRLLVTVDDFGRFDARPAMIKANCFPVKESISINKCKDLLNELKDCGLLLVYQTENKLTLQMCKWDNVPRAKESKYPSMDDTCIHLHTSAKHPHTNAPLTETETKTETKTKTIDAPDGVSQLVWQEFVNHRKAKKAQVTQLVVDGIQAEANKAGFTLEDALKEIVVRNWQGFKAEWVADKQNNSETVYQRSMRLKMQQAVPDIAAKQPTQYEDAVEFFRTIEVPAKQIGESK